MSDQTALMVAEQGELSIEEVKHQVTKIQQLMKSIMHEGEHFGVIPGTDKPTLYKAGAEKLGFTFRLVPDFEVTRRDLPDGHREYEIVCTLRHMQTGKIVGQGVGNCSTLGSKYRYRYDEKNTGRSVPPEYWKTRKDNPKGAQQLLGGFGYKARKIDGTWTIVTQGERIENPDIADSYNTVLKMGKKRAHVDAMITACAASDIFIQDLEDFTDPGAAGASQKSTKTGQTHNKTSGKGSKTSEKQKVKDPIRQDLINEIGEILSCGLFDQKDKDHIRDLISQTTSNDKLVQIKQGCRQEAEKRQAKAWPDGSGGKDPELDRIAGEGWETAGEKPESGGEEAGA